ncbi:RNA polymerase sigma factor [Candidatus Roizmanbacteria bacterium]|nr:RNA polymerase sigma factor [Candidatus Roizmanbacteria bacterium]
MQGPSDKEVIQRIKRGQIENYFYVVKRYTQQIYYYVYKKIYNKDDVDDIVQNAFLKFYKAINRFDLSKKILPYLFEITKNEMKMYYRSRDKTVSLNEAIAGSIKTANTVEQVNIDQLLSFLSKEEKKAFKLLGEGYTYQEITKKLKKPLNTVKTIIRRGRLKMKKENEKS